MMIQTAEDWLNISTPDHWQQHAPGPEKPLRFDLVSEWPVGDICALIDTQDARCIQLATHILQNALGADAASLVVLKPVFSRSDDYLESKKIEKLLAERAYRILLAFGVRMTELVRDNKNRQAGQRIILLPDLSHVLQNPILKSEVLSAFDD